MTKPATNRRDFLKSTAAGTALAANLGLLANAHAAGDDVIKVGVIGCGGRGSGAAENCIDAAPNVKVVALGDVFKFRVENLRDQLTRARPKGTDLPAERCFVGLDAYQKVLDSGIDLVILATPPGFRPLHIQAAVAAGKHIFTEKPVAVDGPGARKVLAAYEEARKKNLGVAAGTQRRHQTGYLETLKRIHDGAIGDILAARCYWNQGNIWYRSRDELTKRGERDTELANQLHNWYHFVWIGGDHIVEQHVHNLDVVNWALHKHPTRCFGVGCRSARPAGDPAVVGHIFDQFSLEYEYDGGVRMHSMCRQIDRTDGNFPGQSGVSESLVGSRGSCQVDAYRIRGDKPWRFAGSDNAPYVQEHTDLIESVRAGKPINELKNVAESSLTAVMGRMAAYTGKVVTWDKALNSQEDTFPKELSWDMSLPVPPVAVPGKTPLV